jgi:hypothetical protein
MRLESIQPPKPFQAEYEGSIPFTSSTHASNIDKWRMSVSLVAPPPFVPIAAVTVFTGDHAIADEWLILERIWRR